jgi:hypothetical protein
LPIPSVAPVTTPKFNSENRLQSNVFKAISPAHSPKLVNEIGLLSIGHKKFLRIHLTNLKPAPASSNEEKIFIERSQTILKSCVEEVDEKTDGGRKLKLFG